MGWFGCRLHLFPHSLIALSALDVHINREGELNAVTMNSIYYLAARCGLLNMPDYIIKSVLQDEVAKLFCIPEKKVNWVSGMDARSLHVQIICVYHPSSVMLFRFCQRWWLTFVWVWETLKVCPWCAVFPVYLYDGQLKLCWGEWETPAAQTAWTSWLTARCSLFLTPMAQLTPVHRMPHPPLLYP